MARQAVDGGAAGRWRGSRSMAGQPERREAYGIGTSSVSPSRADRRRDNAEPHEAEARRQPLHAVAVNAGRRDRPPPLSPPLRCRCQSHQHAGRPQRQHARKPHFAGPPLRQAATPARAQAALRRAPLRQAATPARRRPHFGRPQRRQAAPRQAALRQAATPARRKPPFSRPATPARRTSQAPHFGRPATPAGRTSAGRASAGPPPRQAAAPAGRSAGKPQRRQAANASDSTSTAAAGPLPASGCGPPRRECAGYGRRA
jgi:hypothetical protein